MTIDDNPVDEGECMFEQGMYLYVFHYLCFVNDISTVMSEYQAREEVDSSLELEEKLFLLDDRGNNWKYFIVENNEDNKNVDTLR